MASKSLIINAVGNVGTNTGKKYQKSVTNVNPAVSNEVAGEFARRANALTTNVFGNAQVVKKMDVTEEDSGGGSTGELTITDVDVSPNSPPDGLRYENYETIEGGVRLLFSGSDPMDSWWLDVYYTIG